MVSSTVAPTAAAAVSAAAVAAIASSVGSAAAALCLLAEWRLCASAIGCAMVLLHSHLLAHTLYSERRRRRRRRRRRQQCRTVLQQ